MKNVNVEELKEQLKHQQLQYNSLQIMILSIEEHVVPKSKPDVKPESDTSSKDKEPER
jgi:hypothetical protein